MSLQSLSPFMMMGLTGRSSRDVNRSFQIPAIQAYDALAERLEPPERIPEVLERFKGNVNTAVSQLTVSSNRT